MLLGLLGAVLPYEPTGESWGYWHFAKELFAGNGFGPIDRSPLYTIYLQLFSLVPGVHSLKTESIITPLIGSIGLFTWAKYYFGSINAYLYSALAYPLLLSLEPTSQSLGLALVVCGFLFLDQGLQYGQVFRVQVGFCMVLLSVLMRSTFALFWIFLVGFYLFGRSKNRQLGWRSRILSLLRVHASPLLIATYLFFIIIGFWHSSHPWSNPNVSTDTWLPKGTLSYISYVYNYTASYATAYIPSSEWSDYHDTLQSVYGGATSILGMILANPAEFGRTLLANISNFCHVGLIGFYGVISIAFRIESSIFRGSMLFLAWALLCFACWRTGRNAPINTWLAASAFSIAFLSATSVARNRYMITMLLPFIISGCFYSTIAFRLLADRCRYLLMPKVFTGFLTSLFFSILFMSYSPMQVKALVNDSNDFSIVKATSDLRKVANECRNILTYEHTYFSRFIVDGRRVSISDIQSLPRENKYIGPPPFDCIFVSSNLEATRSQYSNVSIRYRHQVVPAVLDMTNSGARQLHVRNYGYVVKKE